MWFQALHGMGHFWLIDIWVYFVSQYVMSLYWDVGNWYMRGEGIDTRGVRKLIREGWGNWYVRGEGIDICSLFCAPECLAPCPLRVTGEDEKTDMVVALLCVGLYPNVCFHKEKRQLLTSEGKTALIHKTSVNNITKDPKFPSPYFVFGEKVLMFTLTI